MEKKEFNPSDVGCNNGNYFGMPFTTDESALVLVSVPWGVTASYGEARATLPTLLLAPRYSWIFTTP